MISTLRRLLPSGAAWWLPREGAFRSLVEGLAAGLDSVRAGVDGLVDELYPEQSTALAAWERTLGEWPAPTLSDAERRARLVASWRDERNAAPDSVEAALRDRGFDVRVYEWWSGVVDGAPVPRDLTPYFPPAGVGVLLRNKLRETRRHYLIRCGESLAKCGEEVARCGAYSGTGVRYESIALSDAKVGDAWPFVVVIGGETWGAFAEVPEARRAEFEWQCFQRTPVEQWIGLMVRYV